MQASPVTDKRKWDADFQFCGGLYWRKNWSEPFLTESSPLFSFMFHVWWTFYTKLIIPYSDSVLVRPACKAKRANIFKNPAQSCSSVVASHCDWWSGAQRSWEVPKLTKQELREQRTLEEALLHIRSDHLFPSRSPFDELIFSHISRWDLMRFWSEEEKHFQCRTKQ